VVWNGNRRATGGRLGRVSQPGPLTQQPHPAEERVLARAPAECDFVKEATGSQAQPRNTLLCEGSRLAGGRDGVAFREQWPKARWYLPTSVSILCLCL
jgi:hypothetical protein